MELLDVVAAENFLQLLDPLVLGEDGEVEPRGLGDGDDFLQVAVDVLLILKSSETKMLIQTETFSKTNKMLVPGLPFQHCDAELHQIDHNGYELLPQLPTDVFHAQQDVESGDVGETALGCQLREDDLVKLLPTVPQPVWSQHWIEIRVLEDIL